MEFLDKLVIPQPDYNLNLLNYFLILGLSIFLAYAALLLGSTIMSVYFKNKSKSHNDNYANLSRDYISLVTDSWIYAFGLGIIPFLAIIFYLYPVAPQATRSNSQLFNIFILSFF